MILGIIAVAMAGCTHTDPFSLDERQPLEPFRVNDRLIRLTFNPGDDRDPSVQGATLLFSRLEVHRSDLDRCIAIMPARGGTLSDVMCAGGSFTDDTTHAWLQPTLSPDGTQLAYVLEWSDPILPNLIPGRRFLVVAPADQPEAGYSLIPNRVISAPSGVVNDFRDLRWLDNGTVRFIGGEGSANLISLDTTFTPRGLFDFDVAARSVSTVAGVTSPVSYTAAPDGGVWFISSIDPTSIRHVAPGSSVSTVLVTGVEVFTHVTAVGSAVVVIVEGPAGGSGDRVVWLDPTGSEPARVLWIGDTPRHVVGVPGTRAVIAEILRGNGSNLWLINIP